MPTPARSALVALVLLVLSLGIVLGPLRLIVGSDWYTGPWTLGDQIAYGQVVVGVLTLVIGGAGGWYAVEQLRLSQQAFQEDQRARATTREVQRMQLIGGIEALRRSIRHNGVTLDDLKPVLAARQIPMEPRLDATAWDAMKSIIAPHVGDGELAGQIASYFGRIEAFSRLLALEFSNAVSKEGTASWGISGTPLAVQLLTYLEGTAGELRDIGGELDAKLATASAN